MFLPSERPEWYPGADHEPDPVGPRRVHLATARNVAITDPMVQAATRHSTPACRIPGFNDEFTGAAPDIGAFETGLPPLRFGREHGSRVSARPLGDVLSGCTKGATAMQAQISSSAERVRTALVHRQPDRIPLDLGGTTVSGIHVSVVSALRRHFGLGSDPVKVIEIGQMLGEVADDLKEALGIDTAGTPRRMARFGFPLEDWKPFRMDDGTEVLVPGGFTVTRDVNGDTLIYPQGDMTAEPSGRMPKDGYFFDAIVRQPPIDEERLDPRDNLEEFSYASEADLDFVENAVRDAAGSGRAVIASYGGTGLGDIANVPAPWLRNPKGIRDVAEWYMSTRTRRHYIHAVFEGQTEIALAKLERIRRRAGDLIEVLYVCGTDFGTQSSSFCSVATFNDLWAPYYTAINEWVHRNTRWKTFKHSCGAVEKFIPSFIACGFDILNPVQCSAAGMDPIHLKRTYGERIVLWGGGVDTQQTLPFGTPAQVREEVLRRCEVFAPGGGFVFNTVHNIQAQTPIANILAMIEAFHGFNGRGI